MPLFASGQPVQVTEMIAADPRRKLGSYLKNDLIDSLYAQSEMTIVEQYTIESYLPITGKMSFKHWMKADLSLGKKIRN